MDRRTVEELCRMHSFSMLSGALSDTECVPELPDGQTGDEYNFGGYVILAASLSV